METEEALLAKEKDSGPAAKSGSCTTEMAEHFGPLQKVKIRHGEPTSKETQELCTLVLEQEKGKGQCHKY